MLSLELYDVPYSWYFRYSEIMTQIFGDKESKLIIAGNSLLRDVLGNYGDMLYQVVFRPGLMLNLSEMY